MQFALAFATAVNAVQVQGHIFSDKTNPYQSWFEGNKSCSSMITLQAIRTDATPQLSSPKNGERVEFLQRGGRREEDILHRVFNFVVFVFGFGLTI